MSVIFFSATELGNLAAVLAIQSARFGCKLHLENDRRNALRDWAERLADYSVANAWAYNTQYKDCDEAPITAAEITEAADRFMPVHPAVAPDIKRAACNVRLLRYNLLTNAGREQANLKAAKALGEVSACFLGLLLDDLEYGNKTRLNKLSA